MEGKAGGTAVRVEEGRMRERLVIPLGDGQVYEGEMAGLLEATTKALEDGNKTILCMADSQAALRGILSTGPVPASSAPSPTTSLYVTPTTEPQTWPSSICGPRRISVQRATRWQMKQPKKHPQWTLTHLSSSP
jgi:ribonuclease HI